MTDSFTPAMTKRELFHLIGAAAGGSALYMAMGRLDQARASDFKGPPRLDGGAKGKSILILGGGVAGMTAALEMSRAGYKVQLLEYNDRLGGRSWTLKGGDSFTELGGATQQCSFADGGYINPGPWRIPWSHRGLMHYCHELEVQLEPFIQLNHNAYIHSTKAFGGNPQRYRHIMSDYQGHVAELLAKATNKGALDDTLSKQDGEILLESLRSWGALDKNMRYVKGEPSSSRRGWEKDPGGGLTAEPIPSEPLTAEAVLQSGLWRSMAQNLAYEHEYAIFQPVGGMGMVAKGFERAIGHLARLNSKVTKISQNDGGVTVDYLDTRTGAKLVASADYCICTIPLSILSQIEMNVGPEMAAAIRAVPYAASFKIGLEFKRRFWEQDEEIYGGITTTDLPISQISYPSSHYGAKGPCVLLGGYSFGNTAYEITALPPAERVARAVEWGSQIHPQYKQEFVSGIGVGWHRVPWVQGCFGQWSDQARAEHYKNLCALDGRIILAGEHASYIPAWQEGGITSAIDAVTRLHQHIQQA